MKKATLFLVLITAACSKQSDQVTIHPASPAPPAAIDQPKPDQPLEPQVDVRPSGAWQSAFLAGSQFTSDTDSVAAGETLSLPDRREQAQTWVDKDGTFWLFSGKSLETYRNDLWQFNRQTGTWTAISSEGPRPEARIGALTWTAADGTLHLMGGETNEAGLRDHWSFQANQWKQLADFPQARAQAKLVQAAQGTYFFGGYERIEGGGLRYQNDIWQLNKDGQSWALIPAANAGPGPRSGTSFWSDAEGMLWIYAGFAVDSEGSEGHLNDLWRFNPETRIWTLIFGQTRVDACRMDRPEIDGPINRAGALSWTDSAGQLWLFGGETLLHCGKLSYLNDLWHFNPKSRIWSLVRKSSVDPRGRYEQGATLGARSFASTFFDDREQKLWIFGGFGYAAAQLPGPLRDFWMLAPELKP